MFFALLPIRGPLTVGPGSRVHRSVQILGKVHVRIGANTCIGERTWLNVNHRTAGKVCISIGDNSFIGRDNFLSSGLSIVIGDYCLTTVGCQFICSTHVIDNPRLPVITTGTTATDSIVVGANCFFGTGATVLGDVKIGHGSVIGSQAVVLHDVPPFSTVIGSPARVVKRYSFKREGWISVESLVESDLAENPGADEYLRLLRMCSPRVELPWIAAGADMGSF
jgi:acetyltransferase-like isoleucine patch superfamily enzyme